MTTDFRALCVELVRITDAFNSGTPLLSNQGQALDGYSALAAFCNVAVRARAALSELEPPSLKEHAIVAPLSPAAKAVLDAFGKHPLDHDNPSWGILYGALPAALRAAALHLHSEEEVTCGGSSYALMIEVDDLLAIAAELEALYAD